MQTALATLAFVLVLIAGGIELPASAQPPGPMACPMMMEGADVEVMDTEEGVAVTYTTPRPQEVEELRERVRAMAEQHEQRAESRPGRGRRALPPATVSVTDVPEGARLELAAVDPGDVEALREHVAMRAERMGAGGCPMMGDDMPA